MLCPSLADVQLRVFCFSVSSRAFTRAILRGTCQILWLVKYNRESTDSTRRERADAGISSTIGDWMSDYLGFGSQRALLLKCCMCSTFWRTVCGEQKWRQIRSEKLLPSMRCLCSTFSEATTKSVRVASAAFIDRFPTLIAASVGVG